MPTTARPVTGPDGDNPIADDLAAAAAIVTAEMLAALGSSDPAAINCGACDEWARRMQELVGGQAIWLDSIIDADEFPIDEQPRVGHCVLELDGRWYDSEHPAGVEHALLLAGLDAAQVAAWNARQGGAR
jgi:hypothetical protein